MPKDTTSKPERECFGRECVEEVRLVDGRFKIIFNRAKAKEFNYDLECFEDGSPVAGLDVGFVDGMPVKKGKTK